MSDAIQSNPHDKIDQTFSKYIHTHSEIHERWLLEQTLYTGPQRRVLIGMLPIQPRMHILDLGCGFGALTFDIAAIHPVTIQAVDIDSATLGIANQLHEDLRDCASLSLESSIHFIEADAYQLPFADHSFDFVVSRYVFQHLNDPMSALREIRRVLKPGAFLCIIDIDDQLTITYPDESKAFQTLKRAFTKLQDSRGGDRQIGRKIASYMREAGINVVSTLIQPSTSFSYVEPTNLSHRVSIKRFAEARDEIIRNGFLNADEFDQYMREIQTGFSGWQYNTVGHMITLGQL